MKHFTKVWQYGANENDPEDLQDGVAPQKEVPGITNLLAGKGGRVYIPNTEKKGFITSHQIKNYGWIFSRSQNQPGYVKQRN